MNRADEGPLSTAAFRSGGSSLPGGPDPALVNGPQPLRFEGGSTLRDFLTQCFHDRLRIGAALLIGLCLTAIATWLAPSRYTAEAALLLRLGREYVYTPEVGDANSGSPIAYDREQTLLAEAKILTSRDIKEKVLQKMGVAQVYPSIANGQSDPVKQRNAAVVAFEAGLDAELLKGSNLMQVAFTHRDATVAAKVLSNLIEAYIDKRSAIFASATYGTAEADFVARTIRLNAAEAKLAGYKSERNIRAFGEEQSLLLAQRNSVELRQADSAFALAQANGRVASLRKSLEGLSNDVTLSSETLRSDSVENARKLMLDLRLRERDLSSKFTDANPMVMDVRADLARTADFIRDLESRPSRTVRTGRSPARDSVESDLQRSLAEQQQARSSAQTLAAQRGVIEARLAALAGSERGLLSLDRDRRMAESNYEGAAKRLRDEMVLEELDRKRKSSVSIVQPPLVPLQSKSVAPIVLLVGCFLSLCAALLTAFLSALWRDTFLTPEQVQRSLDLPLLASIPKVGP